MTDQQWRRALELYETVADLPLPAAQALLQSAPDEPAVVHKVNEILSETGQEDVISVRQPAARYAGIVIGRYDVMELLGRGSTGEVYAGRDRELGRRVALKIMSAEYATLRSSSQRFLREAQASSALNHPNIVTIHEVITFDASEEQAQNGHAEAAAFRKVPDPFGGTARALCALPVIVMELVEGKPLRALCGNPMPVDAVVPLAVQIMRALAVAHASGIVHRDLKPENVIVRPDGYVKVLDFGLARRSFLQASAVAGGGSSTEGLPVGTLRYMSPEQCRGESATAASDVFAAGIVLYEMLAGRHPFAADSPLDTAHAIAWTEPRPLRQAKPGVPDLVGQLVQSMLAKDAAARPSSEQVVKALDACLDSRVRRPVQKRPAVWLVAALLVALAAVGMFWLRKGSLATNPATVQEPELRIVALANLLGQESFPDPSSDGTRVAFGFSSESSPISHIYVKELGSSKLTRLTNETVPDFEPVFSPDGSRIAFLRRQNGRLNVMIMPSSGGIEHKVGDIADSGISLRVITWDGQGANLIVSEGLGRPEVQMALFAISLDTGVKKQITFPKPGRIDCMPVMSPDGRSLGFARLNANACGMLLAMPLASALKAGSEIPTKRLIPWVNQIFSWNWTFDGHDVLVSRMLEGKTHLCRYPLSAGINSSPPVRVAGLEEEVTQSSVSRLADRLIFTGQTMQNVGIWSYRLNHMAEAGKRLVASAKMDVDARYSPDGKNIVFASARAGIGQIDLWMCASDGSNQRQINMFEEPGEHAVGSPAWSPDGRWIAFDADLPGKAKAIYLLDILGGKPRRLTSAAGSEDSVPSWSRDGRWIYCSSYRGSRHDIWKLPIGGGPPVQVTHDGGFESYESPDGKYLYYSRIGKPGIWRMALPDGPGAAVAGLETVARRNWEGSAKGIYFVSSAKPARLEFFNFSNQQVTRIRELAAAPNSIYRGLSVSPDGRTLLYLQRDQARTNVMVVSNFH